MLNFEPLYAEMDAQKELIEAKGGSVTISANKIKPSEITEGIRSINMPDFASSTATESDVMEGKTFYSGNSTLKVGTMQDESIFYKKILLQKGVATEIPTFHLPDEIKELRNQAFRDVEDSINFYFNEGIESIGNYAFYGCKNTIFHNFSDLKNIKFVGSYSFYDVPAGRINLEALPNSLETISSRAFQNHISNNASVVLPQNLTQLASYAFYCSERRYGKNLVFPSNYSQAEIPSYSFYYVSFDSDFVLPPNCTSVGAYFNYRGSFNNIVIHSNCTAVNNYAFGGNNADAVSEYKLQTVTFERETPPTIGTSIFATQNIAAGFKIYVPDGSVDAYKAVTQLASYRSRIYPMSQKP